MYFLANKNNRRIMNHNTCPMGEVNFGLCWKVGFTDRHLYLVIKLRVVPSGAKSNLLSTGALSTKIHYLHLTMIFHLRKGQFMPFSHFWTVEGAAEYM